jgi:hypothetical protein
MTGRKAAVALLVLAALVPAGCGGGSPAIVYSNAANQPIVSYFRSQALPPESSPKGPIFVVYGDGTVYKRTGAMDYTTGRLTDSQVKALVTSVVGKGFFDMKQLQGQPPPGGAEDHVTVTLKSRSSSVQAPENAGGGFGAIVDQLNSYRIPGAKEYLPDRIVLYATDDPAAEGVVMDWPGDPQVLAQVAAAHTGPGGGLAVSGQAAQQAWKSIAEATRTGKPVVWRAGGRTYANVYANPSFPLPGI